ncbi:PREDICTED: uncharacterized protein LOC108778128 [Cyphomyrmex costatus]|uniref:uncharacterized protein LOC108778128 n=1 Tax=Cyphomyrmex costatus TaxID=456900 RepID=UPI0008523642|nr:PREDICTED: uncharacterized protein LOC108778128 [Cyphomyrmex costatus]
MTQLFTGHGCFGEYLWRIGKTRDARCGYCEAKDIPQHTLEFCPAWEVQLGVLIDKIGGDLSLFGVVKAMLDSEDKLCAVSSYCEQVMVAKEEAEPVKEGIRPLSRGMRAL